MVKPSVKREVVKYAKDTYQIGLGRLCELVGWSRSTWYYESKKDDSRLITELKRLSKSHSNRGIDNYNDRLRHEGYRWARSRVLRVYRELGLVHRPKKRKRLPEALRQPLYQPQELNETWSMDFMSDNLSDGRTFRVLNVIDDCNRECLMCQGSISYPSKRVIDELIEYYNCGETKPKRDTIISPQEPPK